MSISKDAADVIEKQIEVQRDMYRSQEKLIEAQITVQQESNQIISELSHQVKTLNVNLTNGVMGQLKEKINFVFGQNIVVIIGMLGMVGSLIYIILEFKK